MKEVNWVTGYFPWELDVDFQCEKKNAHEGCWENPRKREVQKNLWKIVEVGRLKKKSKVNLSWKALKLRWIFKHRLDTSEEESMNTKQIKC